MIDHNRYPGGSRFIVVAVRHKGCNGMLPQQFVQHFRDSFIRGVQQYPLSALHSLMA
jgi:hypothetical protein